MSEAPTSGFDAGEADYFSAILALQNAKQHTNALPQALLDDVSAFNDALTIEGIDCPLQKPLLLTVADLTAFGASGNITVFRRQTDGAQTVIALEDTAIISLAALLLGGKLKPANRLPSRIETQIIAGFIQAISPDFKPVEAPQSAIIWQDFAGAKLPFDEAPDNAMLLVMINRRGAAAETSEANATTLQHRNYLKQAVGQGILNVEYVLDGGQIALAKLRNLEVGSVLPLTSLSKEPLEARANGKVVFSGILNVSVDRMRFGVTRISSEAPQ
jgi:flagellar motor switch/type III secretory pathway protein FliN